MVKIAVMGDTESIKGFAALGLEIYPCDNDDGADDLFRKITAADYGIVYVTERLALLLKKDIERLNSRQGISVVPIPGVSGNNGYGTASLKTAVEKAVGSDIIFNK